MYQLFFSKSFDRHYTKFKRKDKKLVEKIDKTLELFRANPFFVSLKTHKVNTNNFGEVLSSWVTGDVRIIWDFDKENISIILLLDMGKHSGAKKVYK